MIIMHINTNIQLVINHHNSTAVGQVFDVLFYMDAEGQSYDLRQTPLKVRWTWSRWWALPVESTGLYKSISIYITDYLLIYYTFHFDIEIPWDVIWRRPSSHFLDSRPTVPQTCIHVNSYCNVVDSKYSKAVRFWILHFQFTWWRGQAGFLGEDRCAKGTLAGACPAPGLRGCRPPGLRVSVAIAHLMHLMRLYQELLEAILAFPASHLMFEPSILRDALFLSSCSFKRSALETSHGYLAGNHSFLILTKVPGLPMSTLGLT